MRPAVTPQPAQLLLDDGTVLDGFSFGYEGGVDGEVVFNTGMTGYPESLTDPSYAGQILVCTYPLIGNYGIPAEQFERFESGRAQISGLIVSQYEPNYSHWEAKQSLGEWLREQHVPAITGIDTRALTIRLRTHGVMLGRIVMGAAAQSRKKMIDPNTVNLVAQVSCQTPEWYGCGKKTVAVVDCGVKLSIIRSLVVRGIRVHRVPWDYNFTGQLDHYDGVLLSNGPGDPTQCHATIQYTRQAFRSRKPIFGICLGSQIQALAAGAKTYKLKFGHRAQNQPCQIEGTQRCILTSQNHGYAVTEKTLPADWRVWFRNANDHSIEGLHHRTKPWYSVQFHPEAQPGPQDAAYLFDDFIKDL